MAAAERLGGEPFDRKYTDYRLDTQRSGRVWPDPAEQSAKESSKETSLMQAGDGSLRIDRGDIRSKAA